MAEFKNGQRVKLASSSRVAFYVGKNPADESQHVLILDGGRPYRAIEGEFELVTEKRKLWVNIYRSERGHHLCTAHDSEECADRAAGVVSGYDVLLRTHEIEYEVKG